jgi:hypothetical protein
MKVVAETGQILRINAPDWFQLPRFRAYLDRATHPEQRQRLATFHRHGDAPNEFSDIFIPFGTCPVGVDNAGHEVWVGEGSNIFGAEGLEDIWDAILVAARARQITQGIVWISNLPFDT